MTNATLAPAGAAIVPPASPAAVELVEDERDAKRRELIDAALDKLVADLEAGKSEAFTAWLQTAAKFHTYSLNNQILIAIQRPTATRVAGFKAWLTFNRYVRKGEKGIAIMAPIVRRPKAAAAGAADEQDGAAGAGAAAEDGKASGRGGRRAGQMVGVRTVYVFDVAQTDGEPLPDHRQQLGEPGEYLERLHAFATDKGIKFGEADDLGGAEGVSMGGEILVLASLGAARKFSVTVHELAHEFMHRGENRAELTRQQKEADAESVACIVCEACGLHAVGASADYLQCYRVGRELLEERLDAIRSTATYILRALGVD